MQRRTIGALAAAAVGLGALVLEPRMARGADDADGPQAAADPAADLENLYAWMSRDAKKLNVVVTLWPSAPESAALSPKVQYVVNVRSGPAMRRMTADLRIVCQTAGSELECTVGDTGVSVRGDASKREGIVSRDGKLRVFAGLADDPFFFNRQGFERFVETVHTWENDLAPLRDGAGCAVMTQFQSDTSWDILLRDGSDAPGKNDYAGKRVIAIVLQLDAALVARGGPILGLWASTRRRP